MVSESTKKTLILSVSAIVGITTISTLAYLLIQDDRRAKHLRKIRTLQKQLGHKLHKVEDSIQELVEGDIRLAQVRVRTLRTHAIYTGDPHVKLPSLGLINEQDKIDLGGEIEETQEELIRERTQGYGEDHQKVRQAYKRLDFLIASINERLLRLLESLDAISPRELTDLGDGSSGLVAASGPEIQAFEKIRKRKRSDIAKIQALMAQMDKIAGTFKDRLVAVEIYEQKKAEAEAVAAEEREKEEKLRKEEEEEREVKHQVNGHHEHNHEHVNGHVGTSELVQEGLSFAEVASHNIEEPEILEPTEDLEKMKEGITFADVVSHNTEHEHEHDQKRSEMCSSKSTTTTTTTTVKTTSHSNGEIQVEEHHDKVVEGVSFAEAVASNIPEEEKEDVLEPTEDLEKMRAGITFADVVAEEPSGETDKSSAAAEEGVSIADRVVTDGADKQ
ncbi:hypothetical protein EDD11_008300 [Mortierella claussenii]|nr:hypothetical protein EDD11_008300 [Mortierella claussenii]